MARRYRVLLPVGGKDRGDEIDAGPAWNFHALVESGHLEEVTPKVACPRCTEDPKVKPKDVPHFQKADTLEDHYASEHPGLVAPDFEEIV